MFIAALSTLISSIALVGVAISLLLQARQLRAGQVQAGRVSQVELIKFALNNPTVVEGALGFSNSKAQAENFFRNWYVSHLSMSYDIGILPKLRLQSMAGQLFAAEDTRRWWAAVGRTYSDGATSRRDREFFAVLDEEFQRISRLNESTKASDAPSDPPPFSL